MATDHSTSTARARRAPTRKRPAEARATSTQIPQIVRTYAAGFRKQPAQLTTDEARKIWETAEAYDVQRRVFLTSLTKSGAELIEAAKIADAGESLAQAAVGAENYATKLRELADFMHSAYIRLMLALCEREDMDQLLEAARAKQNGVRL